MIRKYLSKLLRQPTSVSGKDVANGCLKFIVIKLENILYLSLIALLCACAPVPINTPTRIGVDAKAPSGIVATVWSDLKKRGDLLGIMKVNGNVSYISGWGSGFARAVELPQGKHILDLRLLSEMSFSGYYSGDSKLEIDVVGGHHYVVRYDIIEINNMKTFRVWLEDLGTSAQCRYEQKVDDIGPYLALICSQNVDGTKLK